MAIKITNSTTPEVLVYDRIYVTNMAISQEPVSDGSLPPVYKVIIDYKIYAVDASGSLIFKSNSYSITIPDYLQSGTDKAALGDMTMINTLASIQSTISLLIGDKGLHGSTEVVV